MDATSLTPCKKSDALLVIDIQNDFCQGGALAVQDADAIVDPVNALMDRFDCVVFSQDYHPIDHLSFAKNHPNKRPFDRVLLPYGEQTLWPVHCAQGQKGADFHPNLRVDRARLILRKGCNRQVDSYSAFLEADKTPTGLEGYLRHKGIRRVFVVGLATDFCVAWTAIDAATLGFECVALLDLCRAIDADGSLAAAKDAMQKAGVVCATSADLN